MKYNRLVLPAICLVILGLGTAAFYLGPPRSKPAPSPVPQQPAGTPAVADLPAWTGSTVRNFGPVPQCSDQAAVSAVLGLLRDKVPDRTLGLANLRVAGHSQIDDLVVWDCDAELQTGNGERPVHYQVNQLTAGREMWEITLSAAPGGAR